MRKIRCTIAADAFVAALLHENGIAEGSDRRGFFRRAVAVGTGTPVVGGPTEVAAQLADLASADLDGIIMMHVDFVDGLTRFQRDVLPILEKRGLRGPFSREHHTKPIIP